MINYTTLLGIGRYMIVKVSDRFSNDKDERSLAFTYGNLIDYIWARALNGVIRILLPYQSW